MTFMRAVWGLGAGLWGQRSLGSCLFPICLSHMEVEIPGPHLAQGRTSRGSRIVAHASQIAAPASQAEFPRSGRGKGGMEGSFAAVQPAPCCTLLLTG